jgi:hypothetical protein
MYTFAAAGVLAITRSSDKFKERRWHVGEISKEIQAELAAFTAP